MSGDVQPRKRKDKKKKKDDLGIEEPRGTAAALGEGDIFMHSHHEHSTGGHWCAKVIFFSLLAVLVTLIGLIILENRGLSELEANSVESRYSGVLKGWLEEGHDDHHDEHTLELKHHGDEDDDHDEALDHDDDDDKDSEHDDEDHSHEVDDEDEDNDQNQGDDNDDEQSQEEDDEEQPQNDDEDDERNQDDDSRENDDEDNENSQQAEDDDDNENSQQAEDDDDNENLDTADDEDEVEEKSYRRYYRSTDNQLKDDDEDDEDELDSKNDDDDEDDQSAEKDDDTQQNDSQENEDANNNDSIENEDDQDDNNNGSHENDDDEEDQPITNYDDDEQDQPITNDDDEENDQDEDDEDHDDHNDHEDDPEVELEHIEEEVFDEDVSTEAPAPQGRKELEASEEESKEAVPLADDDDDDEEVEQLEPGDVDDLPEELPIPVPKGRPLVEVEDSPSTEKPHDTLAEEEEYEREQEALRKEKEQATQSMWLKLVVGGALLVATQAVLRRATAPRENDEVETAREGTPLADRRMTLIAEPVPPPSVAPTPQSVTRPVIEKEVVKQAPVVKSSPPPPSEEEEEELEVEEEEGIIVEKDDEKVADEKDKELYSDEEEEEDEEDHEPPKPTAPIREPQKPAVSKPVPPTLSKPPVKEVPEKKDPPKVVEKEPTPEEEEDDDVEIIEEEDIEEDLEEEEEDISDVDDAELLSRLEAKYGRLPEPEKPGKQKDGGNSIEDEWPGEPSDAYWRDELDHAEQDLRQGEWMNAVKRASAAELRASGRARFLIARAYDMLAEAKRDNGLLSKAIAAYLELLKMNEKLSNKKLVEVAERTLDRMKFRGSYISAEPIYRLLIRRFPNDPSHRNNLTISFLMANRMDLAEDVIKETLKQWPNDRIALANHGFILKTLHKNYEKAVEAFSKALEGDKGPANEPRYYYHLGDSLLLLGRNKEAHEVHKRGAKLGHFLSPAQRSLYNVERLKSQPWWDVEKTPYARLAKALEKSWKEILKEGRAAQAMYEEEKEGLREKGEWSQLDLFARGREVAGRCARAPVTCSIVRSEAAASGCRRGQVKFSLMEAGTHVRAHVGPTNCRLRMHLGLTNTKDTYIRVDQEIRQWQTGKVLMFDDSFEHEVWHNGTGARLVLIVDVWHPDLTKAEIMQLPSI